MSESGQILLLPRRNTDDRFTSINKHCPDGHSAESSGPVSTCSVEHDG
jgi:hypothetical protein